MTTPIVSDDPLYQLLREGRIAEFNQGIAAGKTTDLTGCDFRHANLQGLVATGLDFSNSYFRESDLRGVDFSSCKSLEGASIYAAKIAGVYFPKELDASEISLSLEHGTRLRYGD